MPYVTSAERIGIEKGRLEGMDKGQLNEAREMVLEALDTKFSSNVPADIHKLIKDLNNRLMLRKLHKSTIQSKDIDDFRKTLEELTAEDPV
jgi:glycine/serine hydroxymethyltransferase